MAIFGQKKKKDDETKEKDPEKTEVIEAKIITEDKSKLLEWLVKEFKESYGGMFSEKDIKEMDIDATSLTLLFGIFGELRILRMLKEKGDQQPKK